VQDGFAVGRFTTTLLGAHTNVVAPLLSFDRWYRMINRIHAHFSRAAPALDDVRERLSQRTGLPIKLAIIGEREGAMGGEMSAAPFSRSVTIARDENDITVYDLPPTRRWSYLEWVLADVLCELGADLTPPLAIPPRVRLKWSERTWWQKLWD